MYKAIGKMSRMLKKISLPPKDFIYKRREGRYSVIDTVLFFFSCNVKILIFQGIVIKLQLFPH